MIKPCFGLLIGVYCLSFSALTKYFIILDVSLSPLEIFPFTEKNLSAFAFLLFISPEQIFLIYLKLSLSNQSQKKSFKKVQCRYSRTSSLLKDFLLSLLFLNLSSTILRAGLLLLLQEFFFFFNCAINFQVGS